jgi:hypothetical protein
MTDQDSDKPYGMLPDEKISQVMIYTPYCLCWGEVVTKEVIRVSTWLRTNAAPDNVLLWKARVLTGQTGAKPVMFPELHIPVSQIIAIHLIPPAQHPLDYDSRDGLRREEPVTVLVGSYRFDGNLLIAQKSNLTKYIEITKEVFSSLYDVDVSYPMLTSMGKLKVPFLLFRYGDSLISSRDNK